MLHRPWHPTWLLALLLQLPSVSLAAQCQVARLAELPVTMNGLRPTVTAQINGTDALFVLDSGAFWSFLTPAAASEYKLYLDYSKGFNLDIRGVGGHVDAAITRVKTFTIFNVPVHNADFIVGGGEPGQGTVGLIGQNILRIADVEYDLAHGVIRLFRPKDCRKSLLTYWLKPGEAYSEIDIERTTPQSPHTIGTVYLDGVKVRAVFDSGAWSSIVGLRAARKAGFTPDGPGVKPGGYDSGLGRWAVPTWIANFPSLKVGDEEIRNARLRFGDIGDFDMLLGSDFFLSHRIYVANSQDKLYFTYNGGPVFNLNPPKNSTTAGEQAPSPAASPPSASEGPTVAGRESQPAAPPGTAPPSPDTSSGTAPSDTDTPKDAAGFARRGAAYAARHDFEHALSDFTRACELAPNEPSYYYQRARVRFATHQSDLALNDLDQALKLKPDYADALVARAWSRLHKKDTDAAVADLDAADRAVMKEADIRLRLAELYTDADRLRQAIAQLDLWIPVHSQDHRLVIALDGRCWARALLGSELDQALHDCNAALRLYPHDAAVHDSRGLIFLRTNKLDKAIADYDSALQAKPKIAWSLYGRGIAKLRKGMKSEGEADLAAAATIAPDLAQRARKLGISP